MDDVQDAGSSDHLDFTKLADYLEALSNPVRLELLHQLRHPHPVGEIRLRPAQEVERPNRVMTRQAVRKHLARLEEAGLIVSRRARREGSPVEEHIVNHQMLYAVIEELRRLSQISPSSVPAPGRTMTAATREPSQKPRGARVIVVHGAREGQVFLLRGPVPVAGRGWVLGRRRGLPVAVDYDPFVSNEHAEIVLRGDRFELLDLRTNKNGTALNWEALPRGGSASLATGDIIGLGRTLLLFRQD